MKHYKSKPVTRRSFVLGSTSILASTAALYSKPWFNVQSANSDIRLGIAGLGGKGLDHTLKFSELPGCRITAICDPDPNQIKKIYAKTKLTPDAVTAYDDFRKLIEDKEVDAIVIATPNHWHALMGVWAMRAGKHVYVEKPVAHSIWEGQLLVDVAKETGMVAQAGTQRRSDEGYPEAAAWLAEGHIGKIQSVHTVIYRQRTPVPFAKKSTPLPAGINYDHWCGPAKKEDLHRANLHYDWHWNWNSGDGELGNNGIHFLDVARVILNEPDLPPSATSIGGRLGWQDDAGETPNSHLTLYDYKTPLLCEVRNLPMAKGREAMDHHEGIRMGLVMHCEGGTLAWPVAKDKDGKTIKKFDSNDGHGHRANWLKAVADNRPQDLNAPIREGHISSALCHLGNVSHRQGATIATEEIHAKFKTDPSAISALQGLTTHLEKNEIDLKKTPLTLGPPITPKDAGDKPAFRDGYEV